MYTLMIVVFVLGYAMIAFEHSLRIDKAAAALLTAVLCWTVLVLGADSILPATLSNVSDHLHYVTHALREHLGEISEILFFLMGAMTIVELVDAHDGFRVITDRIRTTHKVKLLWLIGFITFFLSAALDNLTTTIVMISLLRRLIGEARERWFYAGIVVIAANAGGAWSPIGDVTTTMLWIGSQISATGIVHAVVGKISFDEGKLVDNIRAFMDQILSMKPAAAKGIYVKSVAIAATMSPGVRVSL